jgi:hypothetical protein
MEKLKQLDKPAPKTKSGEIYLKPCEEFRAFLLTVEFSSSYFDLYSNNNNNNKYYTNDTKYVYHDDCNHYYLVW